MTEKPKNLPEHWLRGPISEIPALLQPVAHALLQSLDEVQQYTAEFPIELIDTKPAGRASVAFHLKHLTGVLDRMLTYAKGEQLSTEQFDYLRHEEASAGNQSLDYFVKNFEVKVNETITYLKTVDTATLAHKRTVGRKQLPSTVIGLLFHAAEHSQRHVGQLLVTVSILKSDRFNN